MKFLKKLRDRLKDKVQDMRQRQKEANAAQRRRKELLKQKRARRNVLRKERNAAHKAYNDLPRDVSEERAHKAKVRLVDAEKEFREINKEIDDVVTKYDSVSESIKQRSRRIYHIAHVRLPHVRKRIQRKKKELADNGISPTGGRLIEFDGKLAVEWLVYRMQVARAAGWSGGLNSGFRDPAYSEQLCYQICGAPSCPGRCAGRSSNHTQQGYANGAIDVSDYYTFGSLMRTLNIPGALAFNALGAQDPVHFSSSGR